jgi:nickel-dependent lactate racemase
MVEIWLPYGETEVYVSAEIRNIIGEVKPNEAEPESPPQKIISDSFSNPIGSPSIDKFFSKDCDVAISVDGMVSPSLSANALTEIIGRLNESTNQRHTTNVLIGAGPNVRPDYKLFNNLKEHDELRNLQIINCGKSGLEYKSLGVTKNRTPININSLFMDSEIKIAIGELRLDVFTGLTGAFTSIIPGVTNQETIQANRKLYFKGVEPGKITENPIMDDAFEIASKVGLNYSINLVTNRSDQLLSAYSGDMHQSWRMTVENHSRRFESSPNNNADIVVVSAGGSKYDFDLYNASWALLSADQVVKRNGTIILIAECKEGMGPVGFTRLTHINILSELERRYQFGAEMVHLVKSIAKNKRLILVSALPSYFVEPLGFETAGTANEGYELALSGRRKKTVFIPFGCSTVIK